jgi:hypothetical protein
MATTEADKQGLLGFELNYSLGESTGAIALIVLAILALAKMDPMLLNAIAVIIAGIALLLEDGSLMSRYASVSPYVAARGSAASTSDGITAGTFAGMSGIVLGILAILGIAAEVLAAVAVIVFGAAVLFEFATRAQTAALRMMIGENPDQVAGVAFAETTRRNTSAMLIAVALITLGILALAGLMSSVLVTVGLLGLGAYLFLQSAAAAGSLMGVRL